MVGRLSVPEHLHINGKYIETKTLHRGIEYSYLYLHMPQETEKLCCYCISVASSYYNNRHVR